MPTLKAECRSCSGTGLYSGMCEGKGKAVICGTCEGTGCEQICYRQYVGRVRRRDIKTVKASAGPSLITGLGGIGSEMTYKEFLDNVPEV